ncbi:glycosyltransferase [Polynucleobacter sp. MWH-S4W17]|uniref:glycosyltransferase n=1 Tax=Polynucleobacter sp. MWH-S4W17 TaxID=1855910 RepID=UPI001BFED025|nr:glycosyltransferase [Polynucleobacter sp. MWH-S4W17]QWD81926.1 glycosyltransferase [Polynucleobacter sp. MWH-S4W17]
MLDDKIHAEQISRTHYSKNGTEYLFGATTILLDKVIRRLNYHFGFDFQNPLIKLKLMGMIDKDTIIHLHNSVDFLSINTIRRLAKDNKLIITMHDMWYLTARCSHSFSCNGWRQGCSPCNYLKNSPPVQLDRSSIIAKYKKELFNNKNIRFVSPSIWIADLAKQSWFGSGKNIKIEVINNGINYHKFTDVKIDNRKNEIFSIAVNAVNFENNLYKNYKLTVDVISGMALKGIECKFYLIGAKEKNFKIGEIEVEQTGYISKLKVAEILQRSHLFLHLAKADHMPLAIAEAMYFKLPIVATNVGAISELVADMDLNGNEENGNGYLVDIKATADEVIGKIKKIKDNEKIYELLAGNSKIKSLNYEFEDMYKKYLYLYKEN